MRSTRQFLCVDCEHTWEIAFGAQRPTVCPRCGSPCIGRLTWMGGDQEEQDRGVRHGARRAPRVGRTRESWHVG
jgi:hypothetical protein